MKIKKIDIAGSELGEETLNISVNTEGKNTDHWLYLVIKYQQAKLHRGTHKAKTRSEVRGGGAKPYKQKGTGRARRGTNRTPLRAGGGVIFGPTPRSYDIKINKKLIKNTLKFSLIQRQADTFVIQSEESSVNTNALGKTLAKAVGENTKKILFILKDQDIILEKACRNLKSSIVSSPTSIDLQALCTADKIIISESSLEKIKETLGS